VIPTLSGPMLAPKSGMEPKQVVVLLHGYGSDGADLIGLAPHWQDILPDALFVSPDAHEPCQGNPFGYQWFALDYDTDRVASRQQGLPAARPVLVKFLEDLWAQTGLSARDTILAGFSQGAMMALHVGLSLAEPPMGIIAFSGALLVPQGFGQAGAAMPSVCIVHGDMDTVVAPELGAEAYAALQAAGADVRYHVSQGVGHGISPDGLAFATAFIAEISGRR
jgi:phospholipase/carboxylesterase